MISYQSLLLSTIVLNDKLSLARIFSVYSCQNLISRFLTFCSTVLVDPFDPYSPFECYFYYSS